MLPAATIILVAGTFIAAWVLDVRDKQREDAANDFSSRVPYGDWPAVPTVVPPFHDASQ
jgi:hypothetical protein